MGSGIRMSGVTVSRMHTTKPRPQSSKPSGARLPVLAARAGLLWACSVSFGYAGCCACNVFSSMKFAPLDHPAIEHEKRGHDGLHERESQHERVMQARMLQSQRR